MSTVKMSPSMNLPDFCTLDEHRGYLRDIVRLKLWFLWTWLRRHPDEDFAAALRKRVDIYRKTHLNETGLCPPERFDDPRWLAMETAARAVYEARRGDADAAAFEREAFEVFRESVDARAPVSHQLLLARDDLKAYQCGSLRFDAPHPRSPDRVFFHIANAARPRSIFDDPAYLPACLRDLMDRCEREHGAGIVTTGTWLNSLPRWLALFPPSWERNRGEEERDAQWHYGFWGQFINARYLLNQKYAARLRETGEFPYHPRSSWCRIDELRRHLDERFP